MKKLLILLVTSILLSGCIKIRFVPKDAVLMPVVKTPSQETIQRVNALLDKAVVFVQRSERMALNTGRKLTAAEMQYARTVGVKFPEKIRVVYGFSFPAPKDKILLKEFKALGFGSMMEGGRTNGYGIFIKRYFPKSGSILKHEFVHVRQMEQRKGVRPLVKQYLLEAMTYDYFDIPLEVEAFNQTVGKDY